MRGYSPVLEDARTCAGVRRSTRNGSRLRDNAPRIIVKREKAAVVYDIIPLRLGKLLLAVNSPRFLTAPFTIDVPSYRLRYTWAVLSVPCVYSTAPFARSAAFNRETETEICARNMEIREPLRDLLQPKTATMRLGLAPLVVCDFSNLPLSVRSPTSARSHREILRAIMALRNLPVRSAKRL